MKLYIKTNARLLFFSTAGSHPTPGAKFNYFPTPTYKRAITRTIPHSTTSGKNIKNVYFFNFIG